MKLPMALSACALIHASMLFGGTLEDDYLARRYSVEDGLPQNSVIAIRQTPNGYLWLATYDGLGRFDGVNFAVFNSANTPEMSSSGVYRLCLDGAGRLWGLTDGEQVYSVSSGRFQHWSGRLGLPADRYALLGVSPNGEMVIKPTSRDDLTYRFHGDRFVAGLGYQNLARDELPDIQACDTLLWMLKGTNWECIPREALQPFLPPTGLQTNWVRVVAPSHSGGLWAASRTGLFLLRHGKWVKNFPSPREIPTITATLEDRAGNVWLGTWGEGLWRVDPTGHFKIYDLTRGTSSVAVRSLFEDREGNLWAGTDGRGLLQLRPRAFHGVTAADGLSMEDIRGVSSDSTGRVWALNQWGLDRLETGGAVTHLHELYFGWTILCDSKDRVWIGSFANRLYCSTNGVLSCITNGDMGAICSIYEARNGDVWLGATNGLWHVAGNEVRPAPDFPKTTAPVKTIIEDSSSALWVGTGGGGLWRRKEQQWKRTSPDIADTRALLPDQDSIWVGTQDRGLLWICSNGIIDFRAAAPELPQQISCLATDDFGFLWIGSEKGLWRASLSDLKSISHGGESVSATRYGRLDGMPASVCASGRQGTVCKTPDGRLWFATINGIAVVNPRDLQTNLAAPPVVIEQTQVFGPHNPKGSDAPMTVDGFSTIEPAPLRIAPGSKRLEIHYSANSFTVPEGVRFRYRLEGFDRDWTDVGTRRIAYFQGLSPGTYRFRVIACNNDGMWNQTGASLAFVLEPFFWQTRWFAVACWALGAFIVGAAVRYISTQRLRRSMALLEQQHAVERERARIARDMHDDVGATLTQLNMLSNLSQNCDSKALKGVDFGQISSLAGEAVQKLDELVWAVNPRNDNVSSLADYLCFHVEQILEPAGIRFRLEIPKTLPSHPIHAEARHNLALALKEALNNCVKYSGATEASLTIQAENGCLTVIFKDNGHGFDVARASKLGNGLVNMQQRLEHIGGQCTVRSEPGQGACVAFIIPSRT